MQNLKERSIFLIKSTKNKSFGTAFCIDQDSNGSFLLTCQHVIEACGEEDLEVNGKNVELQVTTSTNELIDLAVVYVKGLKAKPLKLSLATLAEDAEFSIDGFKPHKSGEYKQEELDGKIKKLSQIHKESNTIDTYELYIGEDDNIEKGYSGSAIVSKNSGQVVAVATDRTTTGKQAYAIPLKYLKEVWTELNPKLVDTITPFVGLSAFGREDSAYFFGRDREIEEILTQLKSSSILAVIGDSGSGKSSLVKAGVIPKLLSTHEVIETRPARNPFAELERCITKICESRAYGESDIGYFAKEIASQNPKDIQRVLERIFKDEKRQLLLYVDQFEELFTLCNKNLQKSFTETLLYLLNHQNSHLQIKIVFTMRRDYFNLLSQYKEFKACIKEATYLVRRMNDDNLREVIEKPLELLLVKKEEIEQLSNTILWDMGDEAKEITLLQISLTETWLQRAKYEDNLLSSYVGIDRITGALSHLATNAMESLNAEEKELFKYIFIRIVKYNDTGGITRRLADRDEFSDEAWKLVQKLASTHTSEYEKHNKLGRLLKLSTSNDKSEDEEVIELIHEALTTQWDTYVDWIQTVNKENRKRIHNMLMEQSKKYKKEKDKKLKKKFLLSGYALEESTKLLDDEYRSYLSEFEMKFLEASQKSSDRVVFWKQFGVGTLVVLLGLSGYLGFEANRAKGKSEQLVQKLATTVRNFFNEADLHTASDRQLLTYSYLIEELKDETSPDIIEVVEYSYNNMGIIYEVNHEYRKALLAYGNAMKINPKMSTRYNNIGNVYYKLEEYSNAIDFYLKSITLKKDDGVYINLANAYTQNEDYDNALDTYYKAIELNSKNKIAYNNLIKVYKTVLSISSENDFLYEDLSVLYISIFEVELIEDNKLDIILEGEYINLFENQKDSFIAYKMLKILQDIVNDKVVNIEGWKQEYKGISLNAWSFDSLHKWVDNMKEGKIKRELENALEVFERHGKD